MFTEYLGSSLCGKKISEFYRADLENGYAEYRPLLSIIHKEARDVVKNLPISFDGIRRIGGASSIPHIKLHMC